MKLKQMKELLRSRISEGNLTIDRTLPADPFERLLILAGQDFLTLSGCILHGEEEQLSILGRGRAPFLPEQKNFEIQIRCEEKGMSNRFLLSLVLEESGTAEEIFGKQPSMLRAQHGLMLETPSVINQIYVAELKLQGDTDSEVQPYYSMSGRMSIDEEEWDPYTGLVCGAHSFTGSLNGYAMKEEQWRMELIIPLKTPLYTPVLDMDAQGIAYRKQGSLRMEGLRLTLRNDGADEMANKNSGRATKADLRAGLLTGLGFTMPVRLPMFWELDLWRLYTDLESPLPLPDLSEFLKDVFQVENPLEELLPDILPALKSVELAGMHVGLSNRNPSLPMDNYFPVEEISVVLTVGENWLPSVPFLTLEQFGVEILVNRTESLKNLSLPYLLNGGVFGKLTIPLGGKELVFGADMDFRTLDIEGEMLVQEQGKEPPALSVGDVLKEYQVEAPGIEQLALMDFRFIASPENRSFRGKLVISPGEYLNFHLLGLPIAITDLSGTFDYADDDWGIWMDGEITVGKEQPFTLFAGFYYNHALGEWNFQGGLRSGKISIFLLVKELLAQTWEKQPLFDLELTDLLVEFSSLPSGASGTRPASVYARLEMPWSQELLGVKLLIYGSVRLKKLTDGTTDGELEAGLVLNKFQLRVNYQLLQKEFRFTIYYGNVWLQAMVETRKQHDILTVSMGGITLGGLVEEFIALVNPYEDYKLSAPWDFLNRISLDRFSLEFDMTDKTVTMLYRADLNIAGLVKVDKVGLRYETSKGVKFLIVGEFLGASYGEDDPIIWDAVNENPPDAGGKDAKVLELHYLGFGQHFGNAELLAADSVAEAVAVLERDMRPSDPEGHPPLSYSDQVEWLFGADMTIQGMLRIQAVLNDPSLYGILITVSSGKNETLAQLQGLSLELMYQKVTEDIGMFRATLTVPERFRKFQFGLFSLTLGTFMLEIYTNGNFLLDLGFPKNHDFSSSFVIEAGYYTGRGGFKFGALTGETCRELPKIVNGRFDPVIVIGVGISLGVGRSFDFGVVAGGFSLEAFAIFEGTFASFRPHDEREKDDFYYCIKAAIGLMGRLYLTVDFKIIMISASVEVNAVAAVTLEAYRPMFFAVDLSLKVQAKLRILFIKISFSFHFHMHAEFTIGSEKTPPWRLTGPAALASRQPLLLHHTVGRMLENRSPKSACAPLRLETREEIQLKLLPLYSLENPYMGSGPHPGSPEYCAAFLLTVEAGEKGFQSVLNLAFGWINLRIGERASVGQIRRGYELIREEKEDLFAYLMENSYLSISGKPEGNCGELALNGYFFPMPPSLTFEFLTYGEDGSVTERKTRDFSAEPQVSGPYMEELKKLFEQWSPDPQKAGREKRKVLNEDRQAMAKVLFTDYFEMVITAVLQRMEHYASHVPVEFDGGSAASLCRNLNREHGTEICLERHKGKTFTQAAMSLGLMPEELEWLNQGVGAAYEQSADREEISVYVGVTPHGILMENPELRFAENELNFEQLTYRVRPGDTLRGIAEHYAVTETEQEELLERILSDNGSRLHLIRKGALAGGRRIAGERTLEELPYEAVDSDILIPGTEIFVNRVTLHGLKGKTVEEVCREYEISYAKMAEEMKDMEGVLKASEICLKSAPVLPVSRYRAAAAGQEEEQEIGGLVSRFYLQGMNIPSPDGTGEWMGLYKALGQQLKLAYKEGLSDRLLHKLTVEVCPEYKDWITLTASHAAGKSLLTGTADIGSLSMELWSGELTEQLPAAVFDHKFTLEPREFAPFTEERKYYPAGQLLACEGDTLILPSEEFLMEKRQQLACYEWIASDSQSLKAPRSVQGQDSNWALLLSFRIRKSAKGGNLYEICGAGSRERELLFAALKMPVKDMRLYTRSVPAQGIPEGLYEIFQDKEKSRIIKTDLSLETKNRMTADSESSYFAAFSQYKNFLRLLWECCVIGGGSLLHVEAAEDIPESIFSDSKEAELWLLVRPETALPGCNCIVTGEVLSESQTAELAIKHEYLPEHPEELEIKPTVEPGCAGFELRIAKPPEPADGVRTLDASEKEDLSRNLFSMVSYGLKGRGYCCPGGSIPLLPQDEENGDGSLSYRQSVPLAEMWNKENENSLNPYRDVGKSADISLIYRDVLGNTALTGSVQTNSHFGVTLCPVYNDPVIPLHQWPFTGAEYAASEGNLILSIRERSEGFYAGEGQVQEAAGKGLGEKAELLSKIIWQLEMPDTEVEFSSSLLNGKQHLTNEQLLNWLMKLMEETTRAGELKSPVNTFGSFDKVMAAYGLEPAVLAAANRDTDLSVLFKGAELTVPVYTIFGEGDSLKTAGVSAAVYEKNKGLSLRPGAELIIAGEEGLTHILKRGTVSFAGAAGEIGCSISALAEENKDRTGILAEGYLFDFQGATVQVGAEEGKTASLLDVVHAFSESWQLTVTPLMLVGEEKDGILEPGAVLSYRSGFAGEGESFECNSFSLDGDELFKWNLETVNILPPGTGVYTGQKKVSVPMETSLSEFCKREDIREEELIMYNRTLIIQKPEHIYIPGRTLMPPEPGPYGVKLPDKKGTGISAEEIFAQTGLIMEKSPYLGLVGLLMPGKILEAGGHTIEVLAEDTPLGLKNRLSTLIGVSEAEDLLHRSPVFLDGITVPGTLPDLILSWPLAKEKILSTPSGLLEVTGEVTVTREKSKQGKDSPITFGISQILPEREEGGGHISYGKFAEDLEKCLPEVKMVQGDDRDRPELLILNAGEAGVLKSLHLGPEKRYGGEALSPRFYALAPVRTSLWSDPAAAVRDINPDGTLGEETSRAYAGIDPEVWIRTFLQDMDQVLSAQADSMYEAGLKDELNGLLYTKGRLSDSIPDRLVEILETKDSVTEDSGQKAAREMLSDRLKGSLSENYRNSVMMQYSGSISMEESADWNIRLLGTVQSKEEGQGAQLQMGRLNLHSGKAFLTIQAGTDGLTASSFRAQQLTCTIQEAECIPDEKTGGYERSRFLQFIHPFEESLPGDHVKIELASEIPVPVPLSLYPSGPVFGGQEARNGGADTALLTAGGELTWDYAFTFSHQTAFQDVLFGEVDFNLPVFEGRMGEAGLCDKLAAYFHIRDGLMSCMQKEGDIYINACRTFNSMASEIADAWKATDEIQKEARLDVKSYPFTLRMENREEVLTLILETKETFVELPVISFIEPDQTRIPFVREGNTYRLIEKKGQEPWKDGLHLEIVLKGLNIFEYQSAGARMSVHRNELLIDGGFRTDPAFLYKTEETTFPGRIRAVVRRDEELRLTIPETYLPESGWYQRAVRYVLEEVLRLARYPLMFTGQISYGFDLNPDYGHTVKVPAFYIPRRKYDTAFAEAAAGKIKAGADIMADAAGRHLSFAVTVYSEEVTAEPQPILMLNNVTVFLKESGVVGVSEI